MRSYSSILAWKTPLTEEPHGLRSTGSQSLSSCACARLGCIPPSPRPSPPPASCQCNHHPVRMRSASALGETEQASQLRQPHQGLHIPAVLCLLPTWSKKPREGPNQHLRKEKNVFDEQIKIKDLLIIEDDSHSKVKNQQHLPKPKFLSFLQENIHSAPVTCPLGHGEISGKQNKEGLNQIVKQTWWV